MLLAFLNSSLPQFKWTSCLVFFTMLNAVVHSQMCLSSSQLFLGFISLDLCVIRVGTLSYGVTLFSGWQAVLWLENTFPPLQLDTPHLFHERELRHGRQMAPRHVLPMVSK